jgi:hypothetical protein
MGALKGADPATAGTVNEVRKIAAKDSEQLFKPNSDVDQDPDREHLLAALRSARNKVQLSLSELDEVGVALRQGFVGVDDALGWLERIGAMALFDVRMPPRVQCLG